MSENVLEGNANPKIDSHGNLILDDKNDLRLNKPSIYQQHNDSRTEIAGRYEILGNNKVGFSWDPTTHQCRW